MVRRFRGESHHKVDSKGRVSIPALFRRVLQAGDPEWVEGRQPQLVIVYGDHRKKRLDCYTMEAFYEIEDEIMSLPRGSMERKILTQTMLGPSLTTEVDRDGRLVLPIKQREKIGLTSEAFFISAGDHFQIWNPDTYEAEEKTDTEAWLDNQPEDFDPLILLDQKKGD
ncbi:division/cell wall cluster transcriptional repressor MraZ [Pseudaestuariivita rosea]|uniref:division/cell wall cluster transcriptional repressor MraZ n=1 Tax=Pseudaestuariivita rosea TaxID=2763263 RepID=UPI001ABA8A7F